MVIQPSEFNEIIARLISVYGDKFYPHIRCEIIWESVQEMPREWFSGFVDRWIGSSLKPLLADEIRLAIANEKEKKIFTSSESKEINCRDCVDKGFLFKELPVDDDFKPIKNRSPKPEERVYSFTYRCSCVTGQLQNRSILTWH